MDQQKAGEKKQPAQGTSPSIRQIVNEGIYQIKHPFLVVGIKNEGLFHPVKEPTRQTKLAQEFLKPSLDDRR
jgi:hypothetical protein